MEEEHFSLIEKTKLMMIKGGNGGAKNNLEGGAKSSDGAVAAFDLEAFVKVKISKCSVILRLQIISNIDKELAWLLPILASEERVKCQIFVLDKATEDLIGEQ